MLLSTLSASLNRSLKLLFLLLLLGTPAAADCTFHVAITQFLDHVAVDTVRENVIKQLATRGYGEGKNLVITFETAQGNAGTAGQIARKFAGLEPNVIVALTTPSAQSILKTVGPDGIPVVFSAVTDPVGAGLVSSLKDHKSNITGVRDAPPVKAQFALLKTLFPKAKTIGVVYNPGDSGSVASLKTLKEEADRQGLTLVYGTPMKSADIQAAVLQLVGKVDALYVPLDNMVVSAMKTLSALALKYELPLFAADSGSVESGALACVGYSYPQIGLKTGDMVADILDGKSPETLSISTPEKTDIFINKHALEALGVVLPKDIRKKAQFY